MYTILQFVIENICVNLYVLNQYEPIPLDSRVIHLVIFVMEKMGL